MADAAGGQGECLTDGWRALDDLIPILSLVGLIFDALGGLYLAYDLLGGRHGPLRTFTTSVSYGVMFGTVYALPRGVWFGLAGLFVSGPALSIEIRQRGAFEAHPFLEALAFGLLRGASFAAAGWFSKDPGFGISFGILSAVGFVGAYLIVGPPTVIASKHPRINKTVVRRALFRGGSIGLAVIVGGLISKESNAFVYGVEVGVVTGTASGLLLAIAPSVEAWVDKLPDRRLGGYGAILVLVGSLLQSIQYLLPLLGQSIILSKAAVRSCCVTLSFLPIARTRGARDQVSLSAQGRTLPPGAADDLPLNSYPVHY